MVYAMASIGILGFIVWALNWVQNFAICWDRYNNYIVYIILNVIGINGKLKLLSYQQETILLESSETDTQSFSRFINKTLNLNNVNTKNSNLINRTLNLDLNYDILNYDLNDRILNNVNTKNSNLINRTLNLDLLNKDLINRTLNMGLTNRTLNNDINNDLNNRTLNMDLTNINLNNDINKDLTKDLTNITLNNDLNNDLNDRTLNKDLNNINLNNDLNDRTLNKDINKDNNNNEITFNSVIINPPSHIKFYDKKFLEWFIGYMEGIGNFDLDKFYIIQKNPQILYYIRKTLGFGIIKKCDNGDFKYQVSKINNLRILFQILNNGSKLIFEHTYNKYIKVINLINTKYSMDLPIYKQNQHITLNDAWLSGYIDGKGKFLTEIKKEENSIGIYFSIKEEKEIEKYKEINLLWLKEGLTNNIIIKSNLVILKIETMKSLKVLIKYLDKYPLKSNKNIIFHKWMKLFRIINEGGRGKTFDILLKMAQNIQKFENEDTVQKT
jgi:hypothetical protein